MPSVREYWFGGEGGSKTLAFIPARNDKFSVTDFVPLLARA